MNTPPKCGRIALSIAAFSTCIPVFAQDAAPKADDDVFELSPFHVDGSNDVGYRAESATAGSRLGTQLKDVASSVSVLTESFMDDLGATDLVSALELVAGAESDAQTDRTPDRITGLDGYAGSDFDDPNSSEASVRVRGLGQATTTQGFLEVYIGGDRYNIERAEFLRGPNSILFGLGQPGGLVNYTPITASTKKDSNEVSLIADNFGTLRTTFDLNRVLVDNKLAVRVAGKWGDQKYDVEYARELDKRIYLTATYRPTDHTTLTASYENIDRLSRKPTYRPPHDNVSGWLSLYNEFYNEQVANGLSGAALEQALLDSGFWWDPTSPGVRSGNGTQNLNPIRRATGIIDSDVDIDGVGTGVGAGEVRIGDQLDGRANALAIFYDGSNPNTPLMGQLTVTGSSNATGGRGPNADQRQIIRTAHPLENRINFLDPQVTDTGIFPWDKYDIGALPGNYRDDKNEKIGITLEHKIIDDLYLSASALHEDYTTELNFPIISQTRAIQLDNNRYLLQLDGEGNKILNPNFMRPFIYGRPLGLYRERSRESYQVQVNYDFDFAEKSERFHWLGKHRLTGVSSYSWRDNFEYRWETRANNFIGGVLTSINNFNDAARRIYHFWYIGDAVQAGDTSLNINAIPSDLTSEERDISYNYWTGTGPNVFATASTPLEIRRGSINRGNYTEQINKGMSGSLQSFLWDGRIVTLLGARQDSVFPYVRATNPDPDFSASIGRIDPNVPGRALFPLDTSRDYYLPRGAPRDPLIDVSTVTKSIVFHVIPNKLRVFVNESENFDVSETRSDHFGNVIPPLGGETEEFGMGTTLLDGKLDMRIGFYETTQINSTSVTLDQLSANFIPGFEDRLYDALVLAGRQNEWRTIGTDGQPTTDEYIRPENVRATIDSKSKGFEYSATYNPNASWRFKFELSKLENESTNAGPRLNRWFEERVPFYKTYFDQGLRNDGSTTTTLFEPDGTAALDTVYRNFLNDVMARYISAKVDEGRSNIGVSKYTAKFLANYSFREGRLKGLSIGTNFVWEDGKAIGANTLEVPVSDFIDAIADLPRGDQLIARVGDPSATLFGDSVLTAGLKLGYKTKIFDDKIDWNIQLNVSRLIDTGNEGGLRVRGLNPESVDSEGNAIDNNIYSIAVPRTYQLTSSFSW